MGKVSESTIIEKYGSIENYKKVLHSKLSGKHFYTNGVEDRKFADNEEIPNGWYKGRTNSGKGTKGYFFINNGIVQTQVKNINDIPSGYVIGALPKTELHKQNISKALKSYDRTDKHSQKLKESHSTKECKEKTKKTNLERYGVENPFQSEIVKEKIRKTNLERYGVEYVTKSSEIKDSVRKTMIDRYGVDYACQLDVCRKSGSNDSGPNREFGLLLNRQNISYEREFNLERYSYDFKVGNTLIEIDPSPTHNSLWNPFNFDSNGLDKDYHKNKSLVAEKYNYQCIHIFDWDDKEKIINLLKNRETLYARKCEIRKVSNEDCTKYLSKYHLQGSCKGQEIRLGLYFNNSLVSIMTFGKPRYNKNYQYELIRYCSNYNVIGGAEKLFSYFIKEYKPESIISYCDKSKFRGKVYSRLGFSLLNSGTPSKHWYGLKDKKHITDNLLRQRGFDQLFNESYGKGTSNEELIISRNYVPIYDCGQDSYLWLV